MSVESDRAGTLEIARDRLRKDAAAIQGLVDQLDGSFLHAVELLRDCAGKVLVTGMGTSGATARRIAHLLAVGGTPATFVHAADGLHGSLGIVAHGDVLIAISKGGESDELNEYSKRARESGAVLIAMTAKSNSTLARLSDLKLITITSEVADPGGLMAMGSAIANCALGDALVVSVMEYRSDAWEKFRHNHPGGAVGKAIEGSSDLSLG